MSEEQTNTQTKIFTTIIAILVIVFIISIAVLINRPEAPKGKTIEYNYFTFKEEGGMWKTTLNKGGQDYEIILRFNPEQVEDVKFEGTTAKDFFKPPIHITFDPDSSGEDMKYLALAGAELSLNVVRALGIEVKAACTKNLTDACYDRPIVTCANEDIGVIYIKAEEPTQVIMDGRCITVQGKDFELLKSVDRLLYHWYAIINPIDVEFEHKFNESIQKFKEQVETTLNETDEN